MAEPGLNVASNGSTLVRRQILMLATSGFGVGGAVSNSIVVALAHVQADVFSHFSVV